MMTIPIPESLYWRLRVKALEARTAAREAKDAEAQMHAVMVEAGLNVGIAYGLDDATHSATCPDPPPPAPGNAS